MNRAWWFVLLTLVVILSVVTAHETGHHHDHHHPDTIITDDDDGDDDDHHDDVTTDDDDGDVEVIDSDPTLETPAPKVIPPPAAPAAAAPAPIVVKTTPYKPANVENLLFAELFDGDVFSRWSVSAAEKFSGNWRAVKRATEAIVGDIGLRVMDGAKHHGIATKMSSSISDNNNKDVVVSYEAKFEDSLICGGAYLKLFDSSNLTDPKDLSSFDNETPYVIMFGPDRCGATNKVHLIIKAQNPITNEWVEHHLANPPTVPAGTQTHQYGFHLKHDNTYVVLVDGKSVKSGSMEHDFEPPFTPPQMIDDPSDSKPSTWIDDPDMADPEDVKPEDWDEDEPMTIPDPNAVMPEGWLEDEDKLIPDAAAVAPENWDEEEDGEWTPPVTGNPKCVGAVGCGPWSPPYISNPKYKGKFNPRLIKNPDYKGEWSPQQIENPHYHVNKVPHAVADFDAVGFELWTMQSGLLFDNILVSRMIAPVEQFIAETFKVRSDIETAQAKAAEANKNPGGQQGDSVSRQVMDMLMILGSTYPVGAGVGAVSVVIGVLLIIVRVCKKSPAPAAAAASAKKDDDKVSADDDDNKKEGETPEGEEMKKKSVTTPDESATTGTTKKRGGKKE